MGEYTYVRKTDEEILELATQYLAGSLFTDRQLDRSEDMLIVFLPLGLMGNTQMAEFLALLAPNPEEPTGLIYEYRSKAGPRSYNGYPIFTSMQVLDPTDLRRFVTVAEEMEAHRA